MNAGTLFVLIALIALVILDIRYLRKHGLDECGGDCGKCHGSCKWSDDLKQAKKEIAKEKQRFEKNM